MQQNKTVGAVIGCGAISKLHIGCMKEAGLTVGWLCDTDRQRAEAMKKEFGVESARITTDWNEPLRDSSVDVVAVLTPPLLHCEQTVGSLQAGKYVYCEKPVSRTLKEFDAIFAAEQASGKRAYFTPGRFRGSETPMMMEYIRAGDLGDVYRVEAKHWRGRGRGGVDQGPAWFADSRVALGGILADMGLYFMDRSLYLTGWPQITAVSAISLRCFPYQLPLEAVYDVEEHVLIMARTAGKLTFTFELAGIGYFDDWTTNSLMMLGNKGGLHLTNGRHDEFRFLTEKGGPGKFVHSNLVWKDKRKADTVFYEQIAAAAQGRGEVNMATSSREALVLHEIMAMAYQSSAEKREIKPAELDRQAPIFQKS